MAVSVCPSCHERFRYDSREELEVLAGEAAVVVPDGGPLTFRSHQRVVHACPSRPPGVAVSAPRQVQPEHGGSSQRT
jgi:hypothetical protein